MVRSMLEINSVVKKGRRVSGVPQPAQCDEAPAGLSPMKARLVQRTTERYKKGLKRLSDI